MDKVYPKPLPIQEFGQLLLNMKLIDKLFIITLKLKRTDKVF